MKTTNSQARIKRINAAFKKAEELMNDGYIVQWDGGVVTRFDWLDGLMLWTSPNCASVIYSESNEGWNSYLDLTIPEINKELAERLTVWKRVEVRL